MYLAGLKMRHFLTFSCRSSYSETPLGASSSACRHSSTPGRCGPGTHVKMLQAAHSARRARLSFYNIFKPAGFLHLRAGGRRHSLFPHSATRTTVGVPCGSLARCSGHQYGFTVFRGRNMRRESLGPACSPEGVVVSVIPYGREFTYPPTFWFKPDVASNFGLSIVTMFIGSSRVLTIPS